MSLYSPINNSLAGASRDARKQEASKIKIASGLFILPLIGLCGYVSMASVANSPVVINQLKIRSAGFRGCSTGENDISKMNPNPDGSGTWNATCKGKVYLMDAAGLQG